MPFHAAARDIQQLYDSRSQFVHKAQPVKSTDLDKLVNLCVSAYLTALQAYLQLTMATADNWIHRWHVALDYVSSALAAGVTVDSKAATEAGIHQKL
jgi:hypothetical protein